MSLAEDLAELARLRKLKVECCDCDGISDAGDCECACHRVAAALAAQEKK